MARESSEANMMPVTQLSAKPPASLKGHKPAAATWRRIIRLYDETQGTIITAFDTDLLVEYCLAEEELLELLELRDEIKNLWISHLRVMAKINPKGEDLKAYYDALAQANALLQRFQGMDARMDGKRKMIITMAQSLYLTPRSRAGVAPEEKPKGKPKSKMDELLD